MSNQRLNNLSPLAIGLKRAARYLWTENSIALAVTGVCLIVISWLRSRYPGANMRGQIMAFMVICARIIDKFAARENDEDVQPQAHSVPKPRKSAMPQMPIDPGAKKTARVPKATNPVRPAPQVAPLSRKQQTKSGKNNKAGKKKRKTSGGKSRRR